MARSLAIATPKPTQALFSSLLGPPHHHEDLAIEIAAMKQVRDKDRDSATPKFISCPPGSHVASHLFFNQKSRMRQDERIRQDETQVKPCCGLAAPCIAAGQCQGRTVHSL